MVFSLMIEIVKLWSVLLMRNVRKVVNEIGRKFVSGFMILCDK